jgi:PAS domain S-box-containing protein
MVVTDITEHKRAEEQERELNATLARRIANLVEASVEAVLSVDFESRITDVNEQTCVLTGFAREELIGSAFAALFADAAQAAEYLRRVRAERVVKDFELSVSTQGGKELAVALSAAVFDSSAGGPLGIFWS